MKQLALAFGASLVLLSGCAPALRPPALSQLDGVANGSAVEASRGQAPQALAEAERLRREADQAFQAGDAAGAELLAQRALVAYERALVDARRARAHERLAGAEQRRTTAEAALTALDEQLRVLDETVRELERRAQVTLDALPPEPLTVGSPEREAARLEAGRAISAEGRLLCSAARLLGAEPAALFTELDELDAAFAAPAKKPTSSAPAAPTPIDRAYRLRARCLELLTAQRRAERRANPVVVASDELFAGLGREGAQPYRDDRGVVVVVGAPFTANGELSEPAAALLKKLALVAKAHPKFPLLLVVHGAAAPAELTTRGQRAAKLLTDAGASSPKVEPVGNKLPLLDKKAQDASARNERLELVFVAPAG